MTSWPSTEHAAVGSTLVPGLSTSASTYPTEEVGLMVYEMLVGLHVTNDEMYQTYREKMTPVLVECGGGFGYDFRIAEVLKSQTDQEINRVFTIYFPDKEAMHAIPRSLPRCGLLMVPPQKKTSGDRMASGRKCAKWTSVKVVTNPGSNPGSGVACPSPQPFGRSRPRSGSTGCWRCQRPRCRRGRRLRP